MPDELKHPAKDEECQCVPPELMQEESSYEKDYREKDGRDAVGMANPVDGMLVAPGVLCDPLIAVLGAKHAVRHNTTSDICFAPDARCR
jgi:hypothetical protein